MAPSNQEKIESYRENIAESLRILDEIIEIIRFQDNPEDTVIDQKLEEIKKLPGIGEYTANVLLALVYNQPHIPFDGNIKRVFSIS